MLAISASASFVPRPTNTIRNRAPLAAATRSASEISLNSWRRAGIPSRQKTTTAPIADRSRGGSDVGDHCPTLAPMGMNAALAFLLGSHETESSGTVKIDFEADR